MQAMICFLFAMEKEAAPLLEDCQISEATKIGFSKFYACEKDEKKFLVGITGIGKVFASSAVSALRLKYPTVDGLLNIGVGGSLDAEAAPLLQLIVGDKYVQHDLDTSAIGDPVGMVSGINKVYFEADKDLVVLVKKASKAAKVKPCVGTIASGDRFIASKEDREAIKKQFKAISCDMESSAMAQIAYVYQLPFCAARVVSDTGKDPNEYAENCGEAAKRLKAILDKLIELL